jgi:ParB family chromosome partitioning protein
MGLKRIALDQIEPNPDQPRKLFDEGALRDLASSILSRGLKQPISVRPMGDGRYQVI